MIVIAVSRLGFSGTVGKYIISVHIIIRVFAFEPIRVSNHDLQSDFTAIMKSSSSLPQCGQKRPYRMTTEDYKARKKQMKEARRISDATRAHFQQTLEQFMKSNDDVYTFEANLSRYERAEVHKLWRAMGMKSLSSGAGAYRRISIYKTKVEPRKKEKAEAEAEAETKTNTKTKTKMKTNTKTKTKTKTKIKTKTKTKTKNENENKTKNENENENKTATKTKNENENKTTTKIKTTTKTEPKNTTAISHITSFTFSEEGKTVLNDFFSLYPPGDHEESGKINVTASRNSYNKQMKADDIFLKPAMNKAQIAEKFESVVAKMHSDHKLKQITTNRSKLPIASFKDVITSTLESNQVILICGETGCGKTTQVPQYLLDYMWSKGETCKIVCTQPRRISAISVAERISVERGEPIGESVGYKIRLEKKGGRCSSIVFCTTGVLLKVFVNAGNSTVGKEKSAKMVKDAFSDITHIIVDEIHERDRFSDLMLTIMRDVLPLHPHVRVVLMSATLDAERFSQYFGGCPIIRVPGFTYDVKKLYLEDVLMLVKSKSTKTCHLDRTSKTNITEISELTEDYKHALDEAINLAWSSDELDSLLDIVSTGGGLGVYNYQHSVTGVTPLMVFARKGRVGDICMLLSLGADCHIQDNEGKTSLSWAEHANQKEASEILRKHLNATTLDPKEEKLLLDRYLQDVDPELVDVILIEQLLRKICTESKEGAILVFLPGWDDINRLHIKLSSSTFFEDSSKFLILALHSMVSSIEQKKVFTRLPRGCRKIVLSTNIAETSVTIDDVVFVIDSGRMKEKSYDSYNQVSTLQSTWISKANAKQREGRAGRCQPGICYHLYSKLRAASLLEFQVPEIKRTPLEELCLQVKLLDPNCKIEDVFNKTLDPPGSIAIHNAITVLQDIGALSPNEELTELGERIGSIPVHPLTSKMLLFAISMNCLDPALTLACASGYRDPFTLPTSPEDKKKAAAARSQLASLYGSHGDQLALISAFECWKNTRLRNEETKFCSQYFVASGVMAMLFRMRKRLKYELYINRFIPEEESSFSENSHDIGIVQAVLVAGLYPNVGILLTPVTRGKPFFIENANDDKVRLQPQSVISRLHFEKNDVSSLVIHDDVTRGDRGLSIKSCSIIGPLPVLLLATDIAVAPIDYEGGEEDDNEGNNERCKDKVMSNSDNVVTVTADGWLSFESTALDVAQICCLRERLLAALLFKIKHPGKELPKVLAASLDAIARVFSYDGLYGIDAPREYVDSSASTATGNDIETNAPLISVELVKSLVSDVSKHNYNEHMAVQTQSFIQIPASNSASQLKEANAPREDSLKHHHEDIA